MTIVGGTFALSVQGSTVMDERIYAMADWGSIVYNVDNEKIRGFDVKEGVWKELKGVESWPLEPSEFVYGMNMANLGGNLAVVWEGREHGEEKEV
ncbi:hypothetical protein ACJRO7_021397 [Eucalyptus globulus]|uniref:F-box/kelch-repeat protein n=1 Tax=Eucalyptus globulus TaxID=34317 RepID=A0ABD3KPM4_EUCGL